MLSLTPHFTTHPTLHEGEQVSPPHVSTLLSQPLLLRRRGARVMCVCVEECTPVCMQMCLKVVARARVCVYVRASWGACFNLYLCVGCVGDGVGGDVMVTLSTFAHLAERNVA